MSKELYDNHEENLSLPDQEQSWQKMKRLLEEDEKKRPFLPPGLLRSCAGWGLLAVGVLAVWFFANPQRWFQSDAAAITEQREQDKEKIPVDDQTRSVPGSNTYEKSRTTENGIAAPGEVLENDPSGEKPFPNEKTLETPATKINLPSDDQTAEKSKAPDRAGPVKSSISREKKNITSRVKKNNAVQYRPAGTYTRPDSVLSGAVREKVTGEDKRLENNDTSGKKQTVVEKEVKTLSNAEKPSAVSERPLVTPVDSSKIIDSAVLKKPATAPLIRKKFFVTAGLGLQQQIRISSRDSLDEFQRKTSLSDYVPSVYVRLHKEDKWFLQGEFRYGAPQSLREFSYSRQTRYDSSIETTTTLKLRKTYYHQLPFSFNYYLRPNLSIGAGGIYSRFYRAVTEEEIKSRNLLTQSETVAKKIVEVPHFTDSFFYKTQVHLLLQADYEWRRFSVGIRYTKDIQPYIKYTQPDGRVNEEKNQTFQILLRYRLWKSKRFNISI